MPLLYGEGKKAFQRLQEEIVKQFDDQSIFLWDIHPTKGLQREAIPWLGQDIYGGLLAESPHQFVTKCEVERLYPSETREPIQISRRGSLMRLRLRRVPQKPIATEPWPAAITNLAIYGCYLAALECDIKSNEFVAASSPDLVEYVQQPICVAMLLIRRSDGSYERIFSYYERFASRHCRSEWKFESCYIVSPTWQYDFSELQIENLAYEKTKLQLQWSGPSRDFAVVENCDEGDFWAFLLATNSRNTYGSLIVVVCSARRHSALLEGWVLKDGPEMPVSVLEEAGLEDFREKNGFYLRSGMTGPVLEDVLTVEDKELVLTLSVEESSGGLLIGNSGSIFTLHLSFRTPVNTSISEGIQRAMDGDRRLKVRS